MNIVEQIIKDIEEELYNSTQTRYTCKDGTKITTDVGYVEEWFKQYKDILRKRYSEVDAWSLGLTIQEARDKEFHDTFLFNLYGPNWRDKVKERM